jgi:ADP-ribose pyrophosphatase YjhB (NUDIX family)
MPISDHLRALRARVGHDLLLVPSVTGLVFDEADRLLLVRHANGGVWVAPGGAVEPDESPSDALVREVWEETGLFVEPTSLCGVFGGPEFRVLYANGDQVSYVMAVYRCRAIGGALRADGEEALEVRWVAREALAELPLARWAGTVLPALWARPGRAWLPPARWRPPTGDEVG